MGLLTIELMIGNLGGKFGAEVANVMDTDQVSEIWNYSADQLRAKLGQEQGSWVYNTVRGVDYSEVNPRTKIKSMLRSPSKGFSYVPSAKNFQPAINTSESVMRWLRILTADLASRVVEDADHRLPKTITIHHRHAGTTKSRQATLPTTREMDKNFLYTHALHVWRGIEMEGHTFPTNTISIAISGFGDVEDGVQGIQGFLVKQSLSNVQLQESSPEKADKTESLGKRKRDSDSGIARFFSKTEDSPPEFIEKDDTHAKDVEMEEHTYLCSRCHKHVHLVEMDVHTDYHVALELSKGSPIRGPPSKQPKSKIVAKENKGPKGKGKHLEKGQRKLEFGV